MEEDRRAMLPFPVNAFESRRVETGGSNSLSLVRFNCNDYSVPTKYAHRNVTIVGSIDRVRIVADNHVISEHVRDWEKEKIHYDPVHYLALLERKPNSLDFGKPFAQWKMPKGLQLIRRRLESECGTEGRREFIKILRLLEKHSLEELEKAVQRALAINATTVDVVRILLQENVDHLGFLLQLCEQELLDREKRAAERRLKAAKFPNYKTLEDFDFKAQPSINRVLVSELMRGQYIDNRESVILIGQPGTGKTHLCTALGIAACGLGKKVRFHRVTELITQLMEAREERQLMRMKNQLAKLDLLILDELGYVPASKLGSELLFDVISAAYERTSVIVTTNLPFEQWTEVLGSQRLTGAVLDRLTHHCHILEATGDSYRLKDARRRTRNKKSPAARNNPGK